MSVPIEKAVHGAVVGSTLGAPFRGKQDFVRLAFYEPIPQRMSACPSLDSWLLYSRLGAPETGPTAIPKILAENWDYVGNESGFGHANAERGLLAPASGAFNNPLRTCSEAIGRSLFWGIVFHGRPLEAARWAAFDASFDHAEDGVWVPVAVATAIASLEPGTSFVSVIRSVTSSLPPESRAHRAIKAVVQTVNKPDAVRQVVNQVVQDLGIVDTQDSVLALAIILASISNAKDAGSALCLAAGCGGPAEQTCMAIGVLSAWLWEGVPQDWEAPLGSSYVAGHGLRTVDPPSTLTELTETIEQARLKFFVPELPIPVVVDVTSPFEPVPTNPEPTLVTEPSPAADNSMATAHDSIPEVPAETHAPSDPEPTLTNEPSPVADSSMAIAPDSIPDVPAETPAPSEPEPPQNPPELPTLPDTPTNPLSLVWDNGDLRVEFEYLDGPVAFPGHNWKSAVHFKNCSPLPITVQTALTAPAEWQVATRMSSFLLPGGATTSHGVVLQPQSLEKDGQLELKVNDTVLVVPLLAPQRWYVAGPFGSDDGTAFTKQAPPERQQKRSEPFSGRSGMAVRWQQALLPGRVFDVEPYFQSGPGVVVLYSRFSFAKAGRYRIVAAGSPGVVVTVDGAPLVQYLDTHAPVPRDRPPYSASFEASGETSMIVRLIRDRQPMPPLVVYFIDESGDIIQPTVFHDMPE